MDLGAVLAATSEGDGVVWSLASPFDLNVNLVRLGPHGAIGEHRNTEVDVVVVGVSGSGAVWVDHAPVALGPAVLVAVPKGAVRSIEAGPDGVAYVSAHRRRGPLSIGSPGRPSGGPPAGGR